MADMKPHTTQIAKKSWSIKKHSEIQIAQSNNLMA